MKIKTERYQLNSKVILSDRSELPVTIHALVLTLTKLDDLAIECHLTFHVNLEFYQHIETRRLFNFTSEMRSPLHALKFLAEPEIKLEACLKSDWLSLLIENAEETAEYLSNLSQENPHSPLLCTENWLLLSAKQICEDGERGYRTLWDYLSPIALAQAAENGVEDPTTDALVSFFKDWTNSHLSTEVEQAASELFKNLETTFTEFSNTNLADIDKIFNDLKQEFDNQWQSSTLKTTFLEQVLHFFATEDWQFTKLQGESTLAMVFQGEHGQWKCYAKIREEQHQFVFYSVYPINVPIEQRSPISEFLTRANYGMIIGNFELDFNDGEIRYKTSIDATGDRFSFALIQQLVYTNVTMMDEYLPGIKAVIEDNVEPTAAIAQIESKSE